MPFPIVFPVADGPGRLTEICTFRKSSIPLDEFRDVYTDIMKTVASFPISRQSLIGGQMKDTEIVFLMADWTSAAEKDEFEPGERYQSVKPAFGKLIAAENPSFACHHIILPGESKTPQCGFYSVSHMIIPIEKQDRAAAAFETYLSAASVTPGMEFIAVSASREDPHVVVCISGYLDANAARAVGEAREHEILKSQLDQVVSSGTKYTASRWDW